MNHQYHAQLACDIRSIVRREKIYGLKGEPVRVIAEHATVMIVEGKCGRYAVMNTELIFPYTKK